MSQEVKAIAKGIRISPRKVGVVASIIKKRTVSEALTILEHTERKAALPIIKLINSAVANARHNLKLSTDEINSLSIKTIMVTEGITMKRFKFVGNGRRAKPRPMLKRSSHITVVLGTFEDKKVKSNKKVVAAKVDAKVSTKAPKVATTKAPAKKVTKAPAKKEEAKK